MRGQQKRTGGSGESQALLGSQSGTIDYGSNQDNIEDHQPGCLDGIGAMFSGISEWFSSCLSGEE